MKLALILTLFALPVMAETPLTGDAFEDLVEGKTLTFSNGLAPYGVEYYAPNRRVIWSFVGGECVNGEWYEEVRETGPTICFVYENESGPKCWEVFNINGQIRADFVGATSTTILFEAQESEPLICGGVGA